MTVYGLQLSPSSPLMGLASNATSPTLEPTALPKPEAYILALSFSMYGLGCTNLGVGDPERIQA